MDAIFEDFSAALQEFNGYKLSLVLSPLAPDSQPNRLRAFFKSTNYSTAKQDFKYRVLYDKSNPTNLDSEEGNGWIDVFYAYWAAVGEILKAEDATKANKKVCPYCLFFSYCAAARIFFFGLLGFGLEGTLLESRDGRCCCTR